MFLLPGGRVIFMEFKRPGERPTPLQTHTYQTFRNMGFQVEVHDGKASAIRALSAALPNPAEAPRAEP